MNNIKSYLLEISISFALYWIFAGYLYLIPALKSSPITYFLFLPAGVKLFAILIFKWRGALGTGLAIFSRLMLTDPAQPWVSWFIAATSVTIALYLVVELGLKLFKIDKSLSNLHYYQIVVLATVSSIINGFVFAYVVSSLTIGQMSGDLFHSGFVTVIGNFIGNALFVCAAVLIMRSKLTILSFISKLKTGIK